MIQGPPRLMKKINFNMEKVLFNGAETKQKGKGLAALNQGCVPLTVNSTGALQVFQMWEVRSCAVDFRSSLLLRQLLIVLLWHESWRPFSFLTSRTSRSVLN